MEIIVCYQFADKGFLEYGADFCLTPLRYLLAGKTVVLVNHHLRKEIVAERTFFGTLAAIVGLALSVITGALFYSILVKICMPRKVVLPFVSLVAKLDKIRDRVVNMGKVLNGAHNRV
jgi:hypothetical protein